eukprot:360680-Chlamydomonas_euryale.AAC.5
MTPAPFGGFAKSGQSTLVCISLKMGLGRGRARRRGCRGTMVLTRSATLLHLMRLPLGAITATSLKVPDEWYSNRPRYSSREESVYTCCSPTPPCGGAERHRVKLQRGAPKPEHTKFCVALDAVRSASPVGLLTATVVPRRPAGVARAAYPVGSTYVDAPHVPQDQDARADVAGRNNSVDAIVFREEGIMFGTAGR